MVFSNCMGADKNGKCKIVSGFETTFRSFSVVKVQNLPPCGLVAIFRQSVISLE